MFPFRADWTDLRFIHFRVDAARLQPSVPHPLDLHEGTAWVSLVAFEQRRFRPAGTGAIGSALFGPVASHPFLNVRTYVKNQREPGIFFLAEWVPRLMAAWFGPRTWGLPYRLGRLEYVNDRKRGISDCRVTGDGKLQFRGNEATRSPAVTVAPGSREEFLLERYTAFTRRGRRPYAFRINHPLWRVRDMAAEITRDDLLSRAFPWYPAATLAGAHSSAGMLNVSLGAPERQRGDATDAAAARRPAGARA